MQGLPVNIRSSDIPEYPHRSRLYYVCLNGVTPNEAGCNKGLVFNPDTSKCDVPVNVPGCEDTYETKKPKACRFSCP